MLCCVQFPFSFSVTSELLLFCWLLVVVDCCDVNGFFEFLKREQQQQEKHGTNKYLIDTICV